MHAIFQGDDLARQQLAIAHANRRAYIQIGCLGVAEAVATAILETHANAIAGGCAGFAFDDIAGVSTANHTGDRSDFLAIATTDLMAEHAANDCAGNSAKTGRLGGLCDGRDVGDHAAG